LTFVSSDPFALVDCNSLPKDLLEVEFFGHKKGAFTGAYNQRKGQVELSHGGTLLLEDVGVLPLPLQASLVRYFEEKRVTRIGARDAVSADTRIIAAVDQDLKQAVADGKFRDDLYFGFVAITRTIKTLTLSYSMRYRGWPKAPSRFLYEMGLLRA
jgi:transcriptional regulator with GAF, ATPase, and Fis domain